MWILIIWLSIYNGGGPTTAEFSSRERCNAAGEAVLAAEKYRGGRGSQYGNFICVEK